MTENQFAKKTQQLMSLVSEGNLTDSQSLISNMKAEFTEKIDQISLWQACFYMYQGENETAINELQSTLDQGYWWNPETLQNDPDLSSLKNDNRFINIIQSCTENLNKSRRTAKSIIQQYGDVNADTVLVIFHWRGSNIKDFSEYWLSQEIQEKYQLVFIQSSQPFGYNSYCWDDFNIAKKEILISLSDLDTLNKNIILAGASQGASLAIDLLLENFNTQGFISVVPAIKDINSIKEKLLNTNFNNKSGFILTGTKDSYYEKTLELSSILNEKEIKTKLLITEDLGHFFPDDFKSILLETLEYLNEHK